MLNYTYNKIRNNKERKNKMITINKELTTDENTFRYGHERLLVKVFPSTIGWKTMTATAEILEGEDKGKWTTIYLRSGLYNVDTGSLVWYR
jgi:hypothetical protein